MTDSYTSPDSSNFQASKQSKESSDSTSSVIVAKLAVVIFTMVGGAIMALTINLFGNPRVVQRGNDIFPNDDKNNEYAELKKNDSELCLENLSESSIQDDFMGPLVMNKCVPYFRVSQYFSLTKNGELRQGRSCAEEYEKIYVQMVECNSRSAQQSWQHNDNSQITSTTNSMCLASKSTQEGEKVQFEKCDAKSKNQKWKFVNVNKQSKMYYKHA